MKKYPTGICSGKQLAFHLIYTVIMLSLIISMPLILLFVVKCELWVILLTIFGLVFGLSVIYIIVSALINPIPKAITDFSINLKYDVLEVKLDSILKDKINDDTKNYILSLKSDTLALIDLKESIELFRKI